MPDVNLDIRANTGDSAKKIRDVNASLEEMSGQAPKTDSALGGLWKQFAAGQIAAQLFQRAGREVVDLFRDSIKGAMEQEQADRNLRAALESTGRTVEGNLAHYTAWASAQQRATRYTDDEIEAAQALMLQLTDLDQQGIDRAMKGAMGLASTMGTDLHSATMMVTKGLEGSYQALGRVGIKVDESLSPMEKQAELLRQLETMYQRSTAETDTFGGQLSQATKSIGELKEALGNVLKDALGPFVSKVKDAADTLLDLIATQDEVRRATAEATERNVDFSNRLRDAALSAGMTSAQFGRLAFSAREYSDEVVKSIPLHVREGKSQAELVALLDSTGASYEVNGIKLKALLMETEKGPAILDAFRSAAREAAGGVNEVGRASDGPIKQQSKTLGEINKGWKAQAKAVDDVNDEIKKYLKLTKTLDDEIPGIIEETDDGWKGVFQAMEEGQNEILGPMRMGFLAAGQAAVEAAETAKQAWETKINKILSDMQNLGQAASGVFGAIDALHQANLDRDLERLNAEYEARKKAIEDSLMSEEEKAAALEALDEEFEGKKAAAKREAWNKEKSWAIAEAMINTAMAATSALATKPFLPLGPIMLALALAQGAIQIAAIKAQPAPLAEGGILDGPAVSRGGGFLAGEAGPEAIIPLDSPRGKSMLGDRRRGMKATYHLHFDIGGRKVSEFIVDTVQDAGEVGKFSVKKWNG